MKNCKFYKLTGQVNGSDTFSQTPIEFEYYGTFRAWIEENYSECSKISFEPDDPNNLKSVTNVKLDGVFIGFFRENTVEMFVKSPSFYSGE